MLRLKRFFKGLQIIWALTGTNPIVSLNDTEIEFKPDGQLKIRGRILQTKHDIVLINSSEEFINQVLQASKEGCLPEMIEQAELLNSLDAELTAYENFKLDEICTES